MFTYEEHITPLDRLPQTNELLILPLDNETVKYYTLTHYGYDPIDLDSLVELTINNIALNGYDVQRTTLLSLSEFKLLHDSHLSDYRLNLAIEIAKNFFHILASYFTQVYRLKYPIPKEKGVVYSHYQYHDVLQQQYICISII